MKRHIAIAALLAASFAAYLPTQAFAQVGVSIVIGNPPPARYEAVPAPRRGYIWAPGYWDWNGRRYMWIRGHWEHLRPGQVYYRPEWRHERGGWRLERGGWREDRLHGHYEHHARPDHHGHHDRHDHHDHHDHDDHHGRH